MHDINIFCASRTLVTTNFFFYFSHIDIPVGAFAILLDIVGMICAQLPFFIVILRAKL